METPNKPDVYLWTVKITSPSGAAWYEDRMVGKNGSMVLLRGYPEEHCVASNDYNWYYWCFRSVKTVKDDLPYYKLDWDNAVCVQHDTSLFVSSEQG